VADSLDVVAVGVEDEGSVLTGVVDGPFPGRPVVVVPGGEGNAVEFGDGFVVVDRERDVQVLRGRALDERRRAVARRDVEPLRPFAPDAHGDERREGLPEALGRVEVANADPEVVDHVLALTHTAVVHGLGAVAVRIEDERAVVVVMVLRSETRLAVASVAGARRRLPERVDLVARARDERDV
jgi:hypothetical protein